MIDLTKTTFITAIKIESKDRYENAKTVLGFLNHHFNTNVLIYEVNNTKGSSLDFLNEFTNLNISIYLDSISKEFHRTKYLNFLIKKVKTECVCNYDIDVIFDPQTYFDSQDIILCKEADVLYPYPDGNGQVRVFQSFDRSVFNSSFNIEDVNESPEKDLHASFCGHAFFANTNKYKEFGGENENFISYGPEDRERLMRFIKLGARVGRLNDRFVYHFEHQRGSDSNNNHGNAMKNIEEFEIMSSIPIEEISKRVPPL